MPSPPAAAPRPKKQKQEPASTEVVEAAPGVLRMQLPISMPGLGHVNMYGLTDDRGIAVVDPGLPGPQSWSALKSRLKSAGYRLKDVHTVFVTHSHPDHFGGAGRIASISGARVVTHDSFTTWSLSRRDRQRSEHLPAEQAAELERFANKLAGLGPAERAAVEALTKGIVAKLLHTPSVRLKDDAGTPQGERNAAAVRDLFDLG